MKAEEVLLKSAEDIAEHGHCKAAFYGPGDMETAPVCAYGAMSRTLRKAGEGDKWADDKPFQPVEVHYQAAELLAKAIVRADPTAQQANTYNTITGYNDRASTSAEDIILRFKEAAHG